MTHNVDNGKAKEDARTVRPFAIEAATKADAPFISEAIIEAIGTGNCVKIIGSEERLGELKGIFESLAREENTQYSYRNALRAVDADGNVAGVCIFYDGADLERFREPFLKHASARFGMDTEHVDDETDPSEVYIDTLMVRPEYRGRGIAAALLRAAIAKAHSIGKPAGLLVDYDNVRARRMYGRVGFEAVAPRPFFGIMMEHMQA